MWSNAVKIVALAVSALVARAASENHKTTIKAVNQRRAGKY